MKQESRSINNKSHTFNIGDRKKLMVASYSGCKTHTMTFCYFYNILWMFTQKEKKYKNSMCIYSLKYSNIDGFINGTFKYIQIVI